MLQFTNLINSSENKIVDFNEYFAEFHRMTCRSFCSTLNSLAAKKNLSDIRACGKVQYRNLTQ